VSEQYDHYSMYIQWSDEDNAYVVAIPELLDCKAFGKTYEEAVRRGQDAIITWIDGYRKLGLPIPEPSVWTES
jgi:predicted RNase H-like HicB family nuclease